MVIENPLMPPYLGAGSIPNVVPFTMRENYSQMGLVEGMRHWITNELVPFINENIDKLSSEWVEQMNSLIEQFETIVTGLVADVNGAVEEIGDSVIEAKAAQVAAEAARDLAEQFASQAQEIQDASVTIIVNDENSQLRNRLEELFAPLAGFNALSDVVNTGRLSGTTLDGRFNLKADKTAVDSKNATQDTAIAAAAADAANRATKATQTTVETGRLSPSQMDAEWAKKSALNALTTRVDDIQVGGIPTLDPTKKYMTMGCTIRRVNTTTWEVIADDNHDPVNVQSVTMTSTYVQVVASFVGKRVVTSAITPDDSFAQAAVRMGASVGLYFIRIYFYMGAAGAAPTNPGLLSAVGANVWVYAVWEV